MIEVHVICSNPCRIRDLGIDLERGEERWLALDVVRGSRDLVTEQSKGNIRMTRRSRHPEKAPSLPPPPFVALTQKKRPLSGAAVVEPVAPTPAPVQISEDAREALAREIQEKVLSGLRPLLESLLPAPVAVQAPAAFDPSQLSALLEEAMRRVLPAGGSQTTSATPSVTEEAPLYLPSNLVDKKAKAKIDIVTSSSDEGGLDEAADALRALKKKKEP